MSPILLAAICALSPVQDGKDEIVVEGRVLRVTRRETKVTLTILVEGRRRELQVPREKISNRWILDSKLEKQVTGLRTGYYVGVGYVMEEEVRVLRWVFLIRGGKVNQREAWEAKRRSFEDKEELSKDDRAWREEKEREKERQAERKEEERKRHENEKKRREQEKRNKDGKKKKGKH